MSVPTPRGGRPVTAHATLPGAQPVAPPHALPAAALEPVLTTSELAAHLGVPAQTLHDLRHAGRGPHGFRVGRELRYRLSAVERWLAGLEREDQPRHPSPPAPDGDGDEGDEGGELQSAATAPAGRRPR